MLHYWVCKSLDHCKVSYSTRTVTCHTHKPLDDTVKATAVDLRREDRSASGVVPSLLLVTSKRFTSSELHSHTTTRGE